MNTDIGFGILLMVDSAAYDLFFLFLNGYLEPRSRGKVPELVETHHQITKSGHGVRGVLWSFELHDDLAAPHHELPDVIEWNQVGYLC